MRRPRTLVAVVAAIALVCSIRARFMSDDAYISFRYAQNLVRGHGLVFNVGERVEGMTNFLWTLWLALGLKLEVLPETWAMVWGIAAYVTSVLALAAIHIHLRARVAHRSLPIAAIVWALHPDAHAYATSGLETAAFTALVLVAALALLNAQTRPRAAVLAGALLSLASLTRPDGVLFAAIAGAWLFVFAARRTTFDYAIAFVVIWLPITIVRVRYYGEFFPNTYYAKSASVSWWGQGLHYLALYLLRYWVLALIPLGVALVWIALRRDRERFAATLGPPAALFGAFGVLYTLYIVRVGGDFMFARMLLPATPHLLVVAEIALIPFALRRPRAALGIVVASAGAVVATPSPVSGENVSGIIDEAAFYRARDSKGVRQMAEVVRPILAGLPLRVAFYGEQAKLMYWLDVPVAIEGETGLTDKFIAHQPLPARRGRPGHEKLAPFTYLIDTRKTHLTFSDAPARYYGLDDWIPAFPIRVGPLTGRVLHWDSELMAELRRRGAVFEDVGPWLDRALASLAGRDRAAVARELPKFRRFYFNHVDDPKRRTAFESL